MDYHDGNHGRRDIIYLKKVRNMAKEKGGECLSNKYYKSKSRLKFCCDKGHHFEETYSRIRRGFWCPQCRKENSVAKSKSNTVSDAFQDKQSKMKRENRIPQDSNSMAYYKYLELGNINRKINNCDDLVGKNAAMVKLIDGHFNFYAQIKVERYEKYITRIDKIFRIRLVSYPKILLKIRETIYKHYQIRGIYSNFKTGTYLMFSNKKLLRLLKSIDHPIYDYLIKLAELYKTFKNRELMDNEIEHKVQEFQANYTLN